MIPQDYTARLIDSGSEEIIVLSYVLSDDPTRLIDISSPKITQWPQLSRMDLKTKPKGIDLGNEPVKAGQGVLVAVRGMGRK